LISSPFDGIGHRIQRKRWTPERAKGARRRPGHALLAIAEVRYCRQEFRPKNGRGEIDLIGWDGDTPVFVEVKSAIDDERGTPDRAIDRYKRERLE
jgi:hypothetical protein